MTAGQGYAGWLADGSSSKCSPVQGSADTRSIMAIGPPTCHRPMPHRSAAPAISTTHDTASVTATAFRPPDVVKIATSTVVRPTENQNDQPSNPSNIDAALTRMVATVPTMKSDQTTAKNVRTAML